MIPVGQPDIGPLEAERVGGAVADNWLSKGPDLAEFERQLCSWTDHAHAVPVSSGTAALHLALKAYGAGPGDDVIVPTLTFAAVAAAVVHAEASPVFVGSRADSCLDPKAVKRAIVPGRTKAIVAVHSYGNRAPVEEIAEVAGEIPIIIDASQGHGLIVPGGYTEILSFHGNKVITTGEGGAIVTDNAVIANKCRHWACHAQDDLRTFWHSDIGYNYKLTNLQAALGCAQLGRWKEIITRRRQVAAWYQEELGYAPDGMVFPFDTPWLVNVMVDTRDEVSKRLWDKDIENRRWFPLIHTMPSYVACQYVACGARPTTKLLSERGLSLPTFGAMTREQVQTVCEHLRESL